MMRKLESVKKNGTPRYSNDNAAVIKSVTVTVLIGPSYREIVCEIKTPEKARNRSASRFLKKTVPFFMHRCYKSDEGIIFLPVKDCFYKI